MGLLQILRRALRTGDGPTPKPMTYYQLRREVYKQREAKRRDRRRAMQDRQLRREHAGFYYGTPSVAAALAAEGSGKRLRRHRKDPAGKRRANNLVRVW